MATMKVALEVLDEEINKGTALPDALANFTTALNDVRISTWALLTSTLTRVLAHWRLKRVIDRCYQVAGAQGGQLGEDPAELRRLYAALGQARIEVVRHREQGADCEPLGRTPCTTNL
jgi:hypothetical protein